MCCEYLEIKAILTIKAESKIIADGTHNEMSSLIFSEEFKMYKKTRKSVHRTRMPPPNAVQKKGLYVIVTGIP